MKKIPEKDLTDYLSFLLDIVFLSEKLLSFIPIPLIGTNNKKMNLSVSFENLQELVRR